jgi:5'-deoxynucleotidase YfbR-like HD superfamily hydrolase
MSKWNWVGSIEVRDGHVVDILNIDADMVRLDDVAHSLSHICRFNGHVPNFYSVAEHCVRAYWELFKDQQPPDVCLTGLLHDACEAYVGDMVRPLKRVPEMLEVFKPIEERAMQAVHHKLGGVYPHPKEIHSVDRQLYEWEVKNVMSGVHVPWSSEIAKIMYLETYRIAVERTFRVS